jgi:hypothetical protein
MINHPLFVLITANLTQRSVTVGHNYFYCEPKLKIVPFSPFSSSSEASQDSLDVRIEQAMVSEASTYKDLC